MISELSFAFTIYFFAAPIVIVVPFCYAFLVYSANSVKPITRWKFALISLLLTCGISAIARFLVHLLERVAIIWSEYLEDKGWHVTADIVQAFKDISLLLWLVITIWAGLKMPLKIELIVASVRNYAPDHRDF